MTPTMPEAFVGRVHSITLGKFVGCGLVLIQKAEKPTEWRESLRGFSTQAECGLPSKLFEEVHQRVQAGMVVERRAQVLALMNCDGPDDEEDHWGHGTQIYTTYSRIKILQGLRNRCLPRLETSKLKKNGAVRTKWTRSTVCKALMDEADEWILRQHIRLFEGEHVFTMGLICFLFCRVTEGGRNDDLEVNFRAEDVVEFLGTNGEKMTDDYNTLQRRKGRRTNAKMNTLIKRAISNGIANTKDSRMVHRKRLGYSRLEVNIFEGKIFFIYAEE